MSSFKPKLYALVTISFKNIIRTKIPPKLITLTVARLLLGLSCKIKSKKSRKALKTEIEFICRDLIYLNI
jgi:hypothetical protein